MADPTVEMLLNMQKQIQERIKDKQPKTDRERAMRRYEEGGGVVSEPDSLFLGLKARPTAASAPKPYIPGTELERSAFRWATKDYLPEEKPLFGERPYYPSAYSNTDSLKLAEKGLMVGVKPKEQELSALERHAKALADMEPTPAESLRTHKRVLEVGTGLSPRAAVQSPTPLQRARDFRAQFDPAEDPEGYREADRGVQIALKEESPNVSYEDALKGRTTATMLIDKIQSGDANLSPFESAFLKMFGTKEDAKTTVSQATAGDPEARKKLLRVVEDQARFYDNIVKEQQFTDFKSDYPAADYAGKGVVEIDGVGWFKSNGKEWIPTDKPSTIRGE